MLKKHKSWFVYGSGAALVGALALVVLLRPAAEEQAVGNPLRFEADAHIAAVPDVTPVTIAGEEVKSAPAPSEFLPEGPVPEGPVYTPRPAQPMPGFVERAPEPMPHRNPVPMPGLPLPTPSVSVAATPASEERRPD